MGDTVARRPRGRGHRGRRRTTWSRPSLDEAVADGSRISVRFGRALELTVDGKTTTHWVTATDVATALAEIGRRFGGADLSTSRGTDIDRERHRARGRHPQEAEARSSPARSRSRVTITALTVDGRPDGDAASRSTSTTRSSPRLDADARGRRQGRLHRHPRSRPSGSSDEAVDFETDRARGRLDVRGQDRDVVRAGRDGMRDVTYKVCLPQRRARRPQGAPPGRAPQAGRRDRAGRHQQSAVNYAAGNTVWDALAQCESGGNWAINTGNGYYGGLQFNLGTWQAYGGTGLPSTSTAARPRSRSPSELRDASGGYGSWPGCAASLGLPM